MKFRKVVKNMITVGMFFCGIGSVIHYGKKLLKKEVKIQKRYKKYYELTNQWLMNHSVDKKLDEYFRENNISCIAIYGMGTLGELFYEEIKKTEIKVKCFLDKNAEDIFYKLDDKPVLGLEEFKQKENVNAIVITPVFDYKEIIDELEKNNIKGNFISLEDIICR